MEKLNVVTLTRGACPEWLGECLSSVREHMPANGVHHLSTCYYEADFQRARWESTTQCGGYVAWVDDDDRVVGNALQLCVDALDATGAGLAFTREARIDAWGARLGYETPRGKRTRRDLAMHPRLVHHLAVVRAEVLQPEVLEHAERIGIGIDWLMRAYAGLKYGAVQVPVVGYEWRKHDAQESATEAWIYGYEAAMPALRDVTRGWMGLFDKPIPEYPVVPTIPEYPVHEAANQLISR